MSADAMLLIALSMVSTGLVLGLIFSLVAAGVTIAYGSIWLPNAANGQFFLLAALVCWSLTSGFNVHPALAALVVLIASIPLSYLLEATLIRRFYDVPDRNIAYFVVTLGLTQILSGIFSVTYGLLSDQFSLPPVISGITLHRAIPDAEQSHPGDVYRGRAAGCCCLRCCVSTRMGGRFAPSFKIARLRRCAVSMCGPSIACPSRLACSSSLRAASSTPWPIAST